MEICDIIGYLINNEDEQIAVLTRKASLLNFSEEEQKGIIQGLILDPELSMRGI